MQVVLKLRQQGEQQQPEVASNGQQQPSGHKRRVVASNSRE